MLAISLLSLLLSATPAFSQQVVLDQIHNATSLGGNGGKTWSTGSGAVQTGPRFCNPVNLTFNYPVNTGRSFSFVDATPDGGYFEQADYRMASNASDPRCITAVITFQHGTYQYLSNGSLLLTPFSTDGVQQVEDPCAAVSNQITRYNQTILFSQWRIFPLPNGGVHLNLYEASGEPLAPMNVVQMPASMMPTQQVVGLPTATGTQARRGLEVKNDASRTALYMAGSVSALAGLGVLLVFF